MFEFNGIISGESKKFILRKQKIIDVIALLVITTMLCLIVIPLAILIDPIFLLGLVVVIIPLMYVILPIPQKDQDKILPRKIKFNLDGVIAVEGYTYYQEKHIDDVKLVIDYGEWYYFIFYYKKRDRRIVCQKDLLKNGLIQDFEKFFDSKIVRKINKNQT